MKRDQDEKRQLSNAARVTLTDVIGVLREIRIGVVRYESEIHRVIEEALRERGIRFAREVRIGPRCRIDFLVRGGIGIEVKKGKPNSRKLWEQVVRYAQSTDVEAIVMVVEGSVYQHLTTANWKPVRYVSLRKNWGIAN